MEGRTERARDRVDTATGRGKQKMGMTRRETGPIAALARAARTQRGRARPRRAAARSRYPLPRGCSAGMRAVRRAGGCALATPPPRCVQQSATGTLAAGCRWPDEWLAIGGRSERAVLSSLSPL